MPRATRPCRRAFTLVDLLIVCVSTTLLIGVATPLASHTADDAETLRDAAQQKNLHQAMLIFAEDNRGRFPVPGWVNRLEDPHTGQQLPGRGPEDVAQNHSGPLFSALIAQRYFNPDLCVGPTEVNPNVAEKTDYRWDAYRPDQDTYWDDTFSADLTGTSHISYFHLALCGERKTRHWRKTLLATQPVMSTRGPKHGITDGPQYDRSMTLKLHEPPDGWTGHVVFNDNHVVMHETFTPESVRYTPKGQEQARPDNIFAAELEAVRAGVTMGEIVRTLREELGVGRPLIVA